MKMKEIFVFHLHEKCCNFRSMCSNPLKKLLHILVADLVMPSSHANLTRRTFIRSTCQRVEVMLFIPLRH